MSNVDDPIEPPGDESSTVRFLNTLFDKAIALGARVIHLEPVGERLVVRARIDGTLAPMMDAPKIAAPAIIGRLKVMSDLDVAERRLPQDGRLRLRRSNSEVDFRVTTSPCLGGEAVVIVRHDAPDEHFDHLDDLGFDTGDVAVLRAALARPGMILFSGPTGAGKATSIYTCLVELNRPDTSIATAEWVMRRELPGICQAAVNHEIGLTFSAFLRTYLRGDTDVLFVGEQLDFETTEISFRAVLQGKRVLSTIHTHTAAGVIERLDNMGIEPWVVSNGLSLVVAQRLLRRLCADCRVRDEASPAALAALGVPADAAARATPFRKNGCEKCQGTGFRGRRVLAAELLPVDTDAARDAIRTRSRAFPARRTLRQSALALALAGVTSIEEALLVTPA